MIITRSPLRISLGGGGTDLPSYYRDHGGFFIAGAIDKYVYITIHQTFDKELIVKYSKLERVQRADQLQHPIVREALDLVGSNGTFLEITSMADIPAGTGLGSSGSFTTALLKALHTHQKALVHPRELAEQACAIEIGRLAEPVGKQDQYASAYGGLTCFTVDVDGQVTAEPLRISDETRYNLEDNLLLFFTGYSRSASVILEEQDRRSRANDRVMADNLHRIKALAFDTRDAFERGDLRRFGEIMNEHWQHKKQRSASMSNPEINEWYDMALEHGAIGGKLIGAGGGGFLMFYSEDKPRLRHAMRSTPLREVRFRFDFSGTQVLVQ